MDLTVIGDINLDLISSPLKSYPEKDRQVTLPKFMVQLGGSSAIFACACSKLGLKTKFIGRLGFDLISKFLIREMQKTGVKTKIKRVKGENAGITISLTFEDMKRAMITFRGSNSNLSRKDFSLKDIDGKILHIGGFNLLDSLRKDVYEIFSFAREKGMKTSLDPNWDPKGWKKGRIKDLIKILKTTDFFFPDYEEGKAITKIEEPKKIVEKLLELGSKVVALKCGRRGCFVGSKDEIFYVKGLKVKSVQTTGAGDAFDAGFIKAFLSGLNLKECAEFANVCGAFYTMGFGIERFPSENKIIKIFQKLGSKCHA
ncbi:MAG: sugar kinase [Candidatus Aenigmatarchaeota archaeon]